MSGFGTRKKEQKFSSKKFLKLKENELKEQSISHHINGDLIKAEKGYIAFINNGYSDADIISNYALICQERGDTNKAIKLYEDCIYKFPIHLFSRINLAFLYYSLDYLEKAKSIIDKAIEIKGNLANAYCIKGLIVKRMGNRSDSEALFKKAIEIDSEYVDAYINLGLLYKESNNYEKAERNYLHAIEIDNHSAIAHLNIGACYKEQGLLDKGILHTEIALKLKSNIPNGNLNLATIYREKGDYCKSYEFAKKELKSNSNESMTYQLIGNLFKDRKLINPNAKSDREILSKLLNREDISHREIFLNVKDLVSNEVLKGIMKDERLSENKDFNIIRKDKEILKALTLMIFCSPNWEKALRNIRKQLLLNYNQRKKEDKQSINFLIALASQCFLNEYVYDQEEEEQKELEKLKQSFRIGERSDYIISLLACYESLYTIEEEISFFSKNKSKNKYFNELLLLQIQEPHKEKSLSKTITKYGEIEDSVSLKVKDQYEENPYPRWRYNSYSKENKLNIFSAINSEISPSHIEPDDMEVKDSKANILIAGCGTGIQIIEATRYENCEITAIDLSNSSISYAKRKIEEYGLENINLFEMDILEIKQLKKEFELIECSGVLHHMENPTLGLSNLLGVLKPNGYMKLGLYSKYAREIITRVRELINNEGIASTRDGIRKFRSEVLNSNIKDFNDISLSSDFYSMSMCRDLCFHSHERCYCIKEIKEILSDFNLEFLGFILPQNLKDKYKRQYNNDISLKDLSNWEIFEENNKGIFRDMYQFWVKKVN